MEENLLSLLLHSIDTYVVISKNGKVIYNNIPSGFKVSDNEIIYKDHLYVGDNSGFELNNEHYDVKFFNDVALLRKKLKNDSKTGILSYDGFCEEIKGLLNNEKTFALGVFDIDGFKQINDTYGHQIGDEILEIIAAVFKHNIKSTDLIGRFGGDEFTFAMVNTSKETSQKRIEAIVDTLRRGLKLKDGRILPVTISMGIIDYDYNETFANNFKKADELLYISKENGKNQITIEQGRKR